MKKIFAIALALVMVLSMASAFALNNCSTGVFDWTCPTTVNKCGKATVEVVPYVKVNNSCGGYDWQVSECASAVNTERVYYAVKLTVDANPDQAWFDKATVALTYKGMVAAAPALVNIAGVPAWMTTKKVFDKDSTFYYNFNVGGWDLVEDSFTFGDAHVKEEVVKKAADAKVCVKLESEHSGVGVWKFGDYTINVVQAGADYGIYFTNKNGKTMSLGTTAGKVTSVNDPDNIASEVFATFNLNCGVGTCVDKDIIQKNFGWKDKVEDCFAWGDKAPSIVDAECIVSIPKTGDVSVVAYAVMAVVAAAGAMLKK